MFKRRVQEVTCYRCLGSGKKLQRDIEIVDGKIKQTVHIVPCPVCKGRGRRMEGS